MRITITKVTSKTSSFKFQFKVFASHISYIKYTIIIHP